MKKSDFYYDLPEELIAQTPIEPRDHSRLMQIDRNSGEIQHKHFYDLLDSLQPGDLLVMNNSRVLPARLYGEKVDNGTFIEFLLLEQKGDKLWEIICRRGKKAKVIKKMEQFVVDFRISKNITAPVGEKTIYVRIMKPDDDILLKSRADVFTFEGKEINYSMKKLVEYDGEELPVTMYWNIEEFLSPGTYRVDIFADGNLIGRKSFTLEK